MFDRPEMAPTTATIMVLTILQFIAEKLTLPPNTACAWIFGYFGAHFFILVLIFRYVFGFLLLSGRFYDIVYRSAPNTDWPLHSCLCAAAVDTLDMVDVTCTKWVATKTR